MHPVLVSVVLLMCSNVFMTFSWYAHLRELNNKPWIIAALILGVPGGFSSARINVSCGAGLRCRDTLGYPNYMNSGQAL